MTIERKPRCCSEHRCLRSQPIRVFRSQFTNTWYVVTQWADRGGGKIEAMQKHAMYPADAQRLEMLFNAWLDQDGGHQAITDVALPDET